MKDGARRAPLVSDGLPQRLECGAQLGAEQFRLFPSRKVSTFIDLIVVDELGICPLSPIPRRLVEFVREDAHGSRNGDALGTEEGELILPVKPCRRDPGVGQPVKRDVVEDIVARKAFLLPVECARDELQTARVARPIGESANPVSVCGRDAIQKA